MRRDVFGKSSRARRSFSRTAASFWSRIVVEEHELLARPPRFASSPPSSNVLCPQPTSVVPAVPYSSGVYCAS